MDANARVSAALRELAAVQTSRYKAQAFKRAAATILGLDRPIDALLHRARASGRDSRRSRDQLLAAPSPARLASSLRHTQAMMNAAHESDILARIRKIPISDTLKMEAIAFGEGLCELRVPRQSMYDGVFESFHGGILMTIADSAACFALLTVTAPDQLMTTTDMNIRFLAPCLTDVHVKARVIKRGRLMCPVAVDLTDTAGKLVAVAQVNYMLLDKMPRR